MIRFVIIAVAVLGACSTVERRDDQRDTDRLQSPAGSQLDDQPSLVPIDPPPDDPGLSTCDGTPGQWNGCRGNGCAVCSEQLTNAPCYFQNHPSCARNDTCAGLFFTCNAACPAPTAADINCGGSYQCHEPNGRSRSSCRLLRAAANPAVRTGRP